MVKRIQKSEWRRSPAVRLFWEDLEDLLSIIAPDGNVEVVSGSYEYDSIQELRQATPGGRICHLQLHPRARSAGGYLKLTIDGAGAEIYADPEAATIAARASEFLRSRSRWYLWSVRSAWWRLLWYLCLLVLGFSVVAVIREATGIEWLVYLVLVLIILLPWVLFNRDYLFLKSIIHTDYSVAMQSFWQRHSQTIIRDGIVALIAVLFGLLLGKAL